MLKNFIVHSKQNYRSNWLSPDLEKNSRKNYPWTITYEFNSRGYRDREWPASLKDPVWCIGDSATMGIGAPAEHAWPFVLEKLINKPTINVSILAGSNDFVYRKAMELLTEIQPETIVCNWTFLTRRDLENHQIQQFIQSEKSRLWIEFYNNVKDVSWPACDTQENMSLLPENIQQELLNLYQVPDIVLTDEMLQQDFGPHAILLSSEVLVEYFINLVLEIEHNKKNTKVIHMLLPKFGTAEEIRMVYNQFQLAKIDYVQQQTLDIARDGRHWDILTSKDISNKLLDFF